MTPPRLGDLDRDRHLDDPSIKQRYVTTMFDLVAPSYDRFTRWFSYGMDRGWKRELVNAAAGALPERGVALDLATGTGDLAVALAVAREGARVAGFDPAAQMVRLAQARPKGSRGGVVRYVRGDMMRLPVANASADVVTAGYGFRNVPDHRAAIAEAARVLKPGGSLVVLDFFRPERSWWRPVFTAYLALMGNVYGWTWHREPAAYGYIAASVERFVSVTRFAADLSAGGFSVERVSRKLLGGICLVVAKRQPGGS